MIEEQIGFVNIIKPTGMTSFDVVQRVKKALKTKRVGHLGTLDPAASGVLPIAVGKATKFFDYFLKKDKVYVARVKFGVETDTLDSFGNITKTIEGEVNEDELLGVLKNFVGKISQVPPEYSAVKVNGKRAYELARENANFVIKPRNITIFSIILQEKCEKNEYLFEVHCSAGTYIRTLFSDIAKAINTVATTTAIIRTRSGLFENHTAQCLKDFEENPTLISVGDVFKNLKTTKIDDAKAKKVLNGVKISPEEIGISKDYKEDFLIEYEERIVGLYAVRDEMVKARVFIWFYENLFLYKWLIFLDFYVNIA